MTNPSRKIKKFLNDNNVKNKVSTHSGTITVQILSNCSSEIIETAREMNNVVAHGDLMDDTRYYTGFSVQFDYRVEPTDEDVKKAKEIVNNWSEDTVKDHNGFNYHIRKQLINELGAVGNFFNWHYFNK